MTLEPETMSEQVEAQNRAIRESGLAGRRVRIIGTHPHAGVTGDVAAIQETSAGWGLLVTFDAPHRGAEGCYVFFLKEVEELPGLTP